MVQYWIVKCWNLQPGNIHSFKHTCKIDQYNKEGVNKLKKRFYTYSEFTGLCFIIRFIRVNTQTNNKPGSSLRPDCIRNLRGPAKYHKKRNFLKHFKRHSFKESIKTKRYFLWKPCFSLKSSLPSHFEKPEESDSCGCWAGSFWWTGEAFSSLWTNEEVTDKSLNK